MRRLRLVAFAFVMLAPAAHAQDAAPMKPGSAFRDCSECPEMVVVPAGSFRMGSPEGEADRQTEEGPQYKVTIAKPFAVGKYEVSRGEFADFVRDTGRAADDTCITIAETGKLETRAGLSFRNPGFHQDDRHPVVCVSWEDAIAFSNWLTKRTGKTYRLLSEAEWEYAARAGSSTRYHFGDEEKSLCAYENVFDLSLKDAFKDKASTPVADCRDGFVQTAPVGTFKPNAFGLHDMHGNVAEFVQDCWNWSYDGAPTDGSAWTTGHCVVMGDPTHVVRGGAWGSRLPFLRSASRYPTPSYYRMQMMGFRVARTLMP
jgi:formylglycine-generating enzyme required for sulfatase activity